MNINYWTCFAHPMGYVNEFDYCPHCGRKRPDPPKSRRQEKREELAEVIYRKAGEVFINSERQAEMVAEAVLEWVEKQLPLHGQAIQAETTSYGRGYLECLSDVRKNLGLDQ